MVYNKFLLDVMANNALVILNNSAPVTPFDNIA